MPFDDPKNKKILSHFGIQDRPEIIYATHTKDGKAIDPRLRDLYKHKHIPKNFTNKYKHNLSAMD